ncbi:C40 family peptidase [Roseovarius sp. EL26]|uniref:C40 family peptidase n=1 Tax=Roseovarius sp. EL26 TaxID=2126672 RepID=UPI000EA34002|nr:NlpC/P60 family protein [Roseovarius sp. EL26]
MTDRRLTPANGRVADVSLRGQVEAAQFLTGAARHLSVPVADLLHAPDGRRERQLLLGEEVTLYEDRDGWAFVQAKKDNYVGYLRCAELSEPTPVTHVVSARATHLYPEPDFKSHERTSLSYGSRVQVLASEGRFAQTALGHIPSTHLSPLVVLADDPVSVAELFLGTPYLWGGNSAFGIDCSGLVQAGCLSCGITCPGDSDLQEIGFGTSLDETDALQRGDLLFWKGHVAWVSDPDTILHANAFHMAVAFEPLDEAIKRIADQGDGPVTARKRLGGTT